MQAAAVAALFRDSVAGLGILVRFRRCACDGTRFPDTNMAIQAAFEGQGVALARSAHVWDDLETGRLVRLFDIHCPSDVSVDFVCRPERADRPAVVAFRDWLMDEAAKSQAEWDADEKDKDEAKTKTGA